MYIYICVVVDENVERYQIDNKQRLTLDNIEVTIDS